MALQNNELLEGWQYGLEKHELKNPLLFSNLTNDWETNSIYQPLSILSPSFHHLAGAPFPLVQHRFRAAPKLSPISAANKIYKKLNMKTIV